jgi:hypothetical protein
MVWPRMTVDCAKSGCGCVCSRSKGPLLLSYMEIVFEIYPSTVPEPRWLQEARSTFNAELAAAADTRRQALLMGLHQRCAAMQQSRLPQNRAGGKPLNPCRVLRLPAQTCCPALQHR